MKIPSYITLLRSNLAMKRELRVYRKDLKDDHWTWRKFIEYKNLYDKLHGTFLNDTHVKELVNIESNRIKKTYEDRIDDLNSEIAINIMKINDLEHTVKEYEQLKEQHLNLLASVKVLKRRKL